MAYTSSKRALLGTTALVFVASALMALNPAQAQVVVSTTQPTVSNSTIVSGFTYGLLVTNNGSIGTLTNSGTLSGTFAGASNDGVVQTLSNGGLIYGDQKGLGNQGTISNLINTSIGTILSGTAAAGLQNDTSMGTLTNQGYISSGSAGFANYGTLGALVNSGTINGGPQALYLVGRVETIINSGRFTAVQSGLLIGGTVGALVNSGFIGNATNAINLAGTLGTLVNQSGGTISGNNALYLSGSLGGFENAGIVLGKIDNVSSNPLTITGGAGATVGTLTGTTSNIRGSIVNTLSSLVFGGGNLLLNDNINATGQTVTNAGSNLALTSNINIAGAFSQSSGSLVIDPTNAGLTVSGAANITGGNVTSTFQSTGNYLAGSYTLLSASSLNLSGASVSLGSLTGLDRSSSTVGNKLLLSVANDYVGGSLATLTNSAALTSSATGLYVATTGSIGSMSNTGTLGGAQFGFNNRGTIGTFNNSGRVTNSTFTALWNQGSIGQLVNSGTITNSSWAILNSGTIATLTNTGVIHGAGVGIQNNAVINVLNNSGTLSGNSAIAGAFGTVINSGVIKGGVNRNGGTIGTIIGGSNGAVGTFTGDNPGSQGTIGAASDLTFHSGSLLLNDAITPVNVQASSILVSNIGANITLSTIVNVDANFRQTGGSLNLGSAGRLVVSQAASITGGTVITSGGLSATSTYLKGDVGSTLVSGGTGSNFAGVTVSIGSSVTGLSASAATSGNTLILGINNDYVGNSQSSISNSQTISGVTTALYVASTGSIGTFTNSGVLNGTMYGVNNRGSIGTFSNAQGGGSNVALTYTGNLPSVYRGSVSSALNYGQLSYTGGIGSIADFEISTGSMLSGGTTYQNVISGVGTIEGNSGTVSGSYTYGSNNYDWNLVNVGSNVWNLIVAAMAPTAEQTGAINQTAGLASFIQSIGESAIFGHLADLRSGSANPPQNAQTGNAVQVSTMGAPAYPNVSFANIKYADASYVGSGQGDGYNTNLLGVTFGMGGNLDNADARLGFFGSYSGAQSDGPTITNTVDTFGFGVFGDKALRGGLLLEGSLAFYKSANSITRLDGADLYTAMPDGNAVAAYAKLGQEGLNLQHGLSLKPYLAMSYVYHATEAYDESGSGGAPLHVAADRDWNLSASFGAVMTKNVQLSNGMTLTPTLDAAWVQLAKDGERSVTTNLIGATDTYDAAVLATDQDFARIKASVYLQMQPDMSVTLDYTTELMNDSIDELGEVRLAANLKF